MFLGRSIASSIILLVCLLTGAKAQTFHFAGFGVRDGLIQSNVSGIVQDSAGFYWIATAGGVSRFDGKNFVNYTTADGLADNNVSAIFMDRDQRLWLGHENGSVTRYAGEKFVEIRSNMLPKDKKIFGFYQDGTGAVWIATEEAGAFRILDTAKVSGKGSKHIRSYSVRDGLSQYVFAITEDADGHLWFLTDVGLRILRKGTRQFESFRPEGMPPGQLSTMRRGSGDNILLGTANGGIYVYHTRTGKLDVVVDYQETMSITKAAGLLLVYTVFEDSKHNIWASVSNYGVIRVEASGKRRFFNSSNGLAVNKIRSITEDRDGNILLGTQGEGIQVYSGETFISYNKTNGLSDNQVWAICHDRSGIYWFGTNEGLTRLDPRTNEYRHFSVKDGLPANSVRALAEDRSGNIWIAIWGGRVVKYDAAAGRIVQLPALNDIVSILAGSLMIDRKNQLWIGTNQGIVRYDLGTGVIKTFRTIDGLSENDVTCTFEDKKGNIWIGSQKKGVCVYDGSTIKKYDRQQGLGYGAISSICEDKQGNIWIGTEGGGVYVYDGRSFKNYRAANGLASDFVTLVKLASDGRLWLGTNRGLNRFQPDSGSSLSFLTYNEGDGFTGVECKPRAVYDDKDGMLWFGTVNGAYRYNPKEDAGTTPPPNVRMLNMLVNLRDYPVSAKMKLSYKENNITFSYVGISIRNPNAVYYKLKLEGLDHQYRTVRTTSELFSNLQPGKYTFNLIACNNQNCSAPVMIGFTITPPYWKTWWFYLIVFVAVSGLLFGYIKFREKKLMQEKRILEEKVNERTAEVVEKNKALDEINKDITASIRYAKRIQDAILPPDDFVRKNLPECFILFKPKDIVSGDFYFMESKGDTVIFAAVDCTGHGVPGAFMSIVGHNLLDRVVGEQKITNPARILDELNKGISDTLRQSNLEDNTVRDGMDIALCAYKKGSRKLEFAGAYNPLWLVRNGELTEIKANKFPIGNTKSGDIQNFTNHELDLQPGDTIYIFSDGYSDQFGGPGGKKFKASSLKNLLLKSQHFNMQEQRDLLNLTIENWRGSHEQVDDILVIGARF